MKPVFPIMALIAGLAVGHARAQTSASALEKPDEPVLELSPFVVDASQDVGYQARETLVGGRTRTSLDNIANSIDVITAQLLEDTASLTLQDILSYGNNVDAGYVSENDNNNGALTALWDQNTAYFRGFRTYRGTRNFMFTLMSFNAFSSERIDLSKGPNAVLFGLGEPGGAINYNSKRASLSRNRNEFSLRLDDEGSVRSQLDVEKTLIKDKLGLRAVLLSDRTKFGWDPAYSNTDGVYLAAAFRPFEKTTIRSNYEYRNVNRALGRRIYPRDMFTPYVNAGSPKIIAPVTGNSALIEGGSGPVSLNSIGVSRVTAPRITTLEDGSAFNMQNRASTSALNVGDENNVKVREGVYPKSTLIEGVNGISDAQDKMFEITVEQELANNLFLELGFADWTMERLQGQGSIANVDQVRIDPNGFMPGSTTVVNPHFGQYYSELTPLMINRHEGVKTYRGTLSYGLDLRERSRWLGNHRASVMWENYKWREVWDYTRLMITDTPTGVPVNANQRSGQNRVWVREYYDFTAGDSYMRDITPWYFQDSVDIGSGYTASWLSTDNGRSNLTDSTSKLAVWQGSWFDDRVNLTWGYRAIHQKSYNSQQQGYIVTDPESRLTVWRDPVTGETRPLLEGGLPPEPVRVDDGIARNEGIVVKPLPWLSLTANHATNFSPSSGSGAVGDINGTLSTGATGETVDYGIRLRLWDGKAHFSALRYQTEAQNLMTGGGGRNSPYGNINSMYEILEVNEVIAANPFDTSGASNQVRFNQKSTGYEFTLFAQPVSGLSLRMNAAKTENIASQVGLEVIDYYQNIARPSLINPVYADLSNGGQTIGALLESADNNLRRMQNYDGRRNPPSSTWTGNMNVSYSFDRGTALGGLTVGGAVRWRGPAIIGYWVNEDGTLDLSRTFQANDDFTFDVFARYRKKLTEKINWSVQFNIRNLTDDLGFDGSKATNISSAPDSEVVITNYSLKTPRLFILSNTFSF